MRTRLLTAAAIATVTTVTATTLVACGDDAGFIGASGLYRADSGHAGIIVQTCGHPLEEIRLTEGSVEEFSTTEDRTIARLIAREPITGLIEVNFGRIDDTVFEVEGDPLAVDLGEVPVVYHPRLDTANATVPHSAATSDDIAGLAEGEYINRPVEIGDDNPVNEHGRDYFETLCD